MTPENERLVLDSMKLVKFVLSKYIHIPPGLYEDLEQEGYLALCRAAETYDPEAGKFSTWAIANIIGRIRTYLRENNLVKISRKDYYNGVFPSVSSIDEELDDDGFQLSDILADESSLDDLNAEILEETVLVEAQRIFEGYDSRHINICLEDLCSKMWDEPVSQIYLSGKYGVSQAQVSRILKKFYMQLKQKVL